MCCESFLYYAQSDEFTWRYEEDEADREEVRQENIQEELEQYMMFKRRGSRVENRKGKGSFKRKDKYSRLEY